MYQNSMIKADFNFLLPFLYFAKLFSITTYYFENKKIKSRKFYFFFQYFFSLHFLTFFLLFKIIFSLNLKKNITSFKYMCQTYKQEWEKGNNQYEILNVWVFSSFLTYLEYWVCNLEIKHATLFYFKSPIW